MISYISTAISALDSPKALAPFWVKDSIDNTGRTLMAASEGGKHEAREKFIEENGTSLFWLGGIPAFRFMVNKIADARGKIDTKIHFKRINTNGIQNYHADQLVETVLDANKKPVLDQSGKPLTKPKFSPEDLKGIELGGEGLEAIKQKLKNSGYIPNGAKGKYKVFHTGMTAASVLVNLLMLTVALPKLNQLLSRKIISKEINSTKNITNDLDNNSTQETNILPESETHENNTNPSFGGIKQALIDSFKPLKSFFDFGSLFNFTKMAEGAQMNVVNSMLLLDYGISGSRITFIPRDKNERIEYAVKEGGIILFFYYASDLIKKGLAKIAKTYHTPIALDYNIINDKDFAKKMKQNNQNDLFEFAKIAADDSDEVKELKIIKFIDNELAQVQDKVTHDKVFKNFTLQMAEKHDLLSIDYDTTLKKWTRNAKKYIETDKLFELNKNLEDFYQTAGKNISSTIDQTIRKTKIAKGLAVFGNIAICSVSLSILLPKLQYFIRKHRTQTSEAPGIKYYQELASKNALKV